MKSVQRIKAKVSGVLTPGNKSALPEVRTRLNRLLGGWSAYFSYGSSPRRIKPSTITSTIGCAKSSANGIRSQDVARNGSRASMCTQNWACFVFVACAQSLHRVPYDEASRKAGCGIPHVRLMSGDWKRSYGANRDTGIGESSRKQYRLAAYGHRASRRLYFVIIARIVSQDPAQVRLAQDNNVVHTLAAD